MLRTLISTIMATPLIVLSALTMSSAVYAASFSRLAQYCKQVPRTLGCLSLIESRSLASEVRPHSTGRKTFARARARLLLRRVTGELGNWRDASPRAEPASSRQSRSGPLEQARGSGDARQHADHVCVGVFRRLREAIVRRGIVIPTSSQYNSIALGLARLRSRS